MVLKEFVDSLINFRLINRFKMILVYFIVFSSLKFSSDILSEVRSFEILPSVSIVLNNFENLVFHFIGVASVLSKSIEAYNILYFLSLEIFVFILWPNFGFRNICFTSFLFFYSELFLLVCVFFLFLILIRSLLINNGIITDGFIKSFFV